MRTLLWILAWKAAAACLLLAAWGWGWPMVPAWLVFFAPELLLAASVAISATIGRGPP